MGLWNFLLRQEETSDSYVRGRIAQFLPNSEIKVMLKDWVALYAYRWLKEKWAIFLKGEKLLVTWSNVSKRSRKIVYVIWVSCSWKFWYIHTHTHTHSLTHSLTLPPSESLPGISSKEVCLDYRSWPAPWTVTAAGSHLGLLGGEECSSSVQFCNSLWEKRGRRDVQPGGPHLLWSHRHEEGGRVQR